MISKGFKKQLIVNAYNTQLLPEMEDKVIKGYINNIERTKNFLLFRIDNKSLWLDYKLKKKDDININIFQFSYYLISPFYSNYYYNENEKFKIQENILSNINHISNKKQDIDESPDYVKYLEEVYD
jgi:hypothetical protein